MNCRVVVNFYNLEGFKPALSTNKYFADKKYNSSLSHVLCCLITPFPLFYVYFYITDIETQDGCINEKGTLLKVRTVKEL